VNNLFYTYAYLREDGTPYYIGKGKGRRAFHHHGHFISLPPRDRILFLKKNLSEEEAFKHEIYMIFLYGRKKFEDGILYNLDEGGPGCRSMTGKSHSEDTKAKISQSNKGRIAGIPKSQEHRQRLSNSLRGRKGRSHSPESRQKMSEAAKLRKRQPCSEETKRKISEVKKSRSLERKRREESHKVARETRCVAA